MWKFSKTADDFIVHCNGFEVLRYGFAGREDSKCAPTWGGETVGMIRFQSTDTASHSYLTSLTAVGEFIAAILLYGSGMTRIICARNDFLSDFPDTCTGLPNSSLKTTTTFPVDYGVVLTVSCSHPGHSLLGSEVITCTKETDFAATEKLPVCEKGK